MGTPRQDRVYMARLAEHCERFSDIVSIMKEVVRSSDDLSDNERNLLSSGYRSIVMSLRNAWRAVSTLEEEVTSKGVFNQIPWLECVSLLLWDQEVKIAGALIYYRNKLEKSMEEKCKELIHILDSRLISPSLSTFDGKNAKKSIMEVQVYYLKMKGDYYRYLCEISKGLTYSFHQPKRLLSDSPPVKFLSLKEHSIQASRSLFFEFSFSFKIVVQNTRRKR